VQSLIFFFFFLAVVGLDDWRTRLTPVLPVDGSTRLDANVSHPFYGAYVRPTQLFAFFVAPFSVSDLVNDAMVPKFRSETVEYLIYRRSIHRYEFLTPKMPPSTLPS
jgi:hypothetical protein